MLQKKKKVSFIWDFSAFSRSCGQRDASIFSAADDMNSWQFISNSKQTVAVMWEIEVG